MSDRLPWINGELILDAEQGRFDINENAHGIEVS
jgi:hypothetical protein